MQASIAGAPGDITNISMEEALASEDAKAWSMKQGKTFNESNNQTVPPVLRMAPR